MANAAKNAVEASVSGWLVCQSVTGSRGYATAQTIAAHRAATVLAAL